MIIEVFSVILLCSVAWQLFSAWSWIALNFAMRIVFMSVNYCRVSSFSWWNTSAWFDCMLFCIVLVSCPDIPQAGGVCRTRIRVQVFKPKSLSRFGFCILYRAVAKCLLLQQITNNLDNWIIHICLLHLSPSISTIYQRPTEHWFQLGNPFKRIIPY